MKMHRFVIHFNAVAFICRLRLKGFTQSWLPCGRRIAQVARMNKSSHRYGAIVAAAFFLAIAPCRAPANTPVPPDTIDIWNHKGGNVLEMVQRRNVLQRSGKIVRIRGYCRSACTMLITMPNACLAPNARVGFHAPRLPGTSIIPPLVDQIMGSTYRNGIRERWYAGWNRSIGMQIISAKEYVRLDPQTLICPSLKKNRKKAGP